MQNSENPERFPTKEELIRGGRVDLVEAIVKEGGWLSYGWNLNHGSIENVDFEDGNVAKASGVAASLNSDDSSLANSSQPAESV